MNGLALEGQLGIPFASADAIAERLARHLESIAALNPLYRRWMPSDTRRHRSAVPAILTWPPDPAELHTWVNESAAFESRKGRCRCGGDRRHCRRSQLPVLLDGGASRTREGPESSSMGPTRRLT